MPDTVLHTILALASDYVSSPKVKTYLMKQDIYIKFTRKILLGEKIQPIYYMKTVKIIFTHHFELHVHNFVMLLGIFYLKKKKNKNK